VEPVIFFVGDKVPAAFYLRVVTADPRQNLQDYTFDPVTLAPATIDRGSGQIYLILFGTGFRNAKSLSARTASGQAINDFGRSAHILYAGLDQQNLGPLPADLPSGLVTIRLEYDGVPANEITIRLQ
jgi:hypothetical protein